MVRPLAFYPSSNLSCSIVIVRPRCAGHRRDEVPISYGAFIIIDASECSPCSLPWCEVHPGNTNNIIIKNTRTASILSLYVRTTIGRPIEKNKKKQNACEGITGICLMEVSLLEQSCTCIVDVVLLLLTRTQVYGFKVRRTNQLYYNARNSLNVDCTCSKHQKSSLYILGTCGRKVQDPSFLRPHKEASNPSIHQIHSHIHTHNTQHRSHNIVHTTSFTYLTCSHGRLTRAAHTLPLCCFSSGLIDDALPTYRPYLPSCCVCL